jgi:SAM-dependent methyltransferase
MTTPSAGLVAPASPFVVAQMEGLRAAAARGPILDLACGRGRHARWLAARGLRVVALDRDRAALRALSADAKAAADCIDPLQADAEHAAGLPLRAAQFGAIIVTRFLHRPLCATLDALLQPGGLLVYETFTKRNRELGQGPANPAFLLEERELVSLFPGLEVLRFEEGLRLRPDGDGGEWVASLLARKPTAARRSR